MQSLSARDRAAGRKEGRAEGMAEALLRLLSARRIRVGERARQRILKCQDLAQLKRWFDWAVNATQLSGVLEDESGGVSFDPVLW